MQQMSNNHSMKLDVNMVQNTHASPFEGHFAFTIVTSMERTTWIVDSGASTHICCNVKLLDTTYRLDQEVKIYLPDGTSRIVTHGGKVKLNNYIVLIDVLYVPGFTHNLISVAQLIHALEVKCLFFKTHCVF